MIGYLPATSLLTNRDDASTEPVSNTTKTQTGATAQQPKTSDSYITPNSLVSNQLENFMSTDSDMLQKARSMGGESVSNRGILGGDLKTKGQFDAMYNVALPVAQGDASSYTQAALQQQETDAAKDMLGLQHEYQLEEMDAEAQDRLLEQNKGFHYAEAIASLQYRLDSQLAESGYNRQDSQLLANLVSSAYRDMIGVAGTTINNTDVEVSDAVLNWANQYSNDLVQSVSGLLGYNFDF